MTRSIPCAVLAALLAATCSVVVSHAAMQNPAALTQARQANEAAMREYTWKSRTEVKVNGETRHVTLELVRYDIDGRLQKTPIGGEPADRASKPAAPLGRGGLIQQRVTARKKEQFEDLMEEIAARAQAYATLPQERLTAFVQRASMSPGTDALDGTLRIDGRAILLADDVLSIWIDRTNHAMRRLEVATTLEDDRLYLSVDYRSLPNGLTYPARTIARYPQKELEIAIETFEYTHTGGLQ